MDARHFDALVRTITEAGSRRGLLGLLAALPLIGGLAGAIGDGESALARRRKRRARPARETRKQDLGAEKKKKKKKRKKKAICTSETATQTCAERCGSVLNNCNTAVDCGSCDCSPECPACQVCDPETRECVPDPNAVGDGCGDGQVCQPNGTCSCPDGQRLCGSNCIPNSACCSDGDCSSNQKCCNRSCTNITTAENCGTCGNRCPGLGSPNANVTCANPATPTCSFACFGDAYDVDGNPATGCESPDDGPPAGTPALARSLGSAYCYDGESQRTFGGVIVSDTRTHISPPAGFNASTGSTPDFWRVRGLGQRSQFEFCVNDVVATISTSGGGSGQCYRLTVQTNLDSAGVDVTGNSGPVSVRSLSYGSGTDILFKIEQVCETGVRARINYTVDYHL